MAGLKVVLGGRPGGPSQLSVRPSGRPNQLNVRPSD